MPRNPEKDRLSPEEREDRERQMAQAPTPGPLGVGQEETIAFNLCAVHGFDPDFVKTQRNFALAVIREYEVVCRPRVAPTAPVEASGSEWSKDEVETLISDALSDSFDLDLDAGDGAKAVLRVLEKESLLTLLPQPSGGTREASKRLAEIAAAIEFGSGNGISFREEGAVILAADLRALLSARPLALGGQQREDAAWSWLNQHVECDPADRDYSADEMVDAFMAGQSVCLGVPADLVRRILAAWPDDHVMGAPLAVDVANALSTTPARAEADRVQAAVTIIRDRLRQIWEGDAHPVYSGNPPEPSHDEEGDFAKLANEAVEALNSVFPVPDALAALKSTAAK